MLSGSCGDSDCFETGPCSPTKLDLHHMNSYGVWIHFFWSWSYLYPVQPEELDQIQQYQGGLLSPSQVDFALVMQNIGKNQFKLMRHF